MFDLHDEDRDQEGKSIVYLWKACVVVAAIYMFYLLELLLHGLTDYLDKVGNAINHLSCVTMIRTTASILINFFLSVAKRSW